MVSGMVRANRHLITQQKQIVFACENCQIPTPCLADVSMTGRGRQNLVENAIRYAPSGRFVQIAVVLESTTRTKRIENAMDSLSKPVRTYLLGSAPDGSLAGRPTGVGTGLVIVRKIPDLHQS